MAFIAPDEAHDLWAEVDEGPDGLYLIVALDPGGTTGWTVMGVHPEALNGDPDVPILSNIEWWTAGQFKGQEWDQCDQAVELINSWPSARLVSEKFVLRSRVTTSDVTVLDRMNAVIGWAVRPRYIVLQQPSLAMSTVTDDRQKLWGFWRPGEEHARDAIKHALTFLKRQKERAIKAQAVLHGSQ